MILLLDIILLVLAIVLSMVIKVDFYNKWKYFSVSLVFTSILFFCIEKLFAILGIWQYENSNFIGVTLYAVLIETILYNISLLFLFLVLFEYLKVKLSKTISNKWTQIISILLFVIFSIVLISSWGVLYLNLISILLLIIIFQFILFFPRWLSLFYVTFAFFLTPLFIIQFTYHTLAFVSYNMTQKSDIYILNIPIENLNWSLLLFISGLFFYHFFMPKKLKLYHQNHIISKDESTEI